MKKRGNRVEREWLALMSCKGGNARSDSCALREETRYERSGGS